MLVKKNIKLNNNISGASSSFSGEGGSDFSSGTERVNSQVINLERLNLKTFIIVKIIQLLLISVLFAACNVSPQPIAYGSDACHFCNMTIVDKQHASQLVTAKGKAFKYDAVECMIHSLQDEFKSTEMAYYLVSDFNKPGELMDATKASYLVSEKLQSPMGANLSAFLNADSGAKAQEKFTGNLYTWTTIQEHLKLR